MRLSLRVRDVALASWTTDRGSVARAVPAGLEPAAVDRAYLVSLVALRISGGRLGPFPVLPFSQLNVHTYVHFRGERAVFFLRSYVTPSALGGALFAAPLRPARLRFRPGTVEAPGPGVSLRYRLGDPAEPAELVRQELGLFEAAGVRSFRIRRGPGEWTRAEPVGGPRVDVVLALGFELTGEPSVFYAGGTSLETELPPERVTEGITGASGS